MRFIEELSLNAWPALENIFYDGWVLRFANGYSKRANSVNPLYPSQEDVYQKIRSCEEYYGRKRLPTIFKITPEAFPSDLDNILAQSGYRKIDCMSVHVLSLADAPRPSMNAVSVENDASDCWLDHYCLLNGTHTDNRATLKKILENIVSPKFFVLLQGEDGVAACGMGVLERGFIGLFNIVVDARVRRQGFGEQLVLNMLNLGRKSGAQQAYLQVAQHNFPALRLYERIGFKEMYQYWYRVK